MFNKRNPELVKIKIGKDVAFQRVRFRDMERCCMILHIIEICVILCATLD